MLKFSVLLISSLLLGHVLTQQSDYILHFDSIEILKANEEFIDGMKITLFQFNETSQAVNTSGTLKKDLDNNIKVVLRASKEQENKEYKEMTNLKDINMCDVLDKNQFGLKDLLAYGNFTTCPWKAGYYVINNVMIDSSKLPPAAPIGKYIMETEHSAGDTLLLHTRYTGSIVART